MVRDPVTLEQELMDAKVWREHVVVTLADAIRATDRRMGTDEEHAVLWNLALCLGADVEKEVMDRLDEDGGG